MKLKLAATAAASTLCALSAAHAQSTVSIYGLLDTGVTYINNVAGGSRTAVDSGIWQSSRLGFRGMEDLGGDLRAEFVLEAGVNVDTGAGSAAGALAFNRQSFVGLRSGTWGTFTLGRQYDFLYVNVLPLGSELFVGGAVSGIAGGPGGTAGSTNILDAHYGGTRYDNSIKWVKPFGPITVGLMHGYGLEGTAAGTKVVNSALLSYKEGPLAVGLGWTKDDFTAANAGNTANKVAAIKALYKAGSFTFLANYGSASSRNTQATNKPFEVGVAYKPADSLLTVGIALGQAKVTNTLGAGTRINQVGLGAIYALSTRTSLYAMALNNRSQDAAVYRGFVGAPGGATAPSSTAGQSAVRVGMTHVF